jgi:hypothetical protein
MDVADCPDLARRLISFLVLFLGSYYSMHSVWGTPRGAFYGLRPGKGIWLYLRVPTAQSWEWARIYHGVLVD